MKSSNGRCGQLIARAFAIFFIICLAECAAAQLRQAGSSGGIKKASGSCLSYGHSCWGAHGKRGSPKSAPLERSRTNDGQNLWFLSRYFKLNPEHYKGQYDINADRKFSQQAPIMRDVVSNFLYPSEQQKSGLEEDYSEPQVITTNDSDGQEVSNNADPFLSSNEDETQAEERINRRRKLIQSLAYSSMKM